MSAAETPQPESEPQPPEGALPTGDLSPEAMGARIREKVEREAEAAEADEHDATPPGEATAQHLREFADENPHGDEPPDDPQTEMCPICLGWGLTKTGSLVQQYLVRPCNRCNGSGYLEIPLPQAEITGQQTPEPHPPETQPPEQLQPPPTPSAADAAIVAGTQAP